MSISATVCAFIVSMMILVLCRVESNTGELEEPYCRRTLLELACPELGYHNYENVDVWKTNFEVLQDDEEQASNTNYLHDD